MRLINSHKNGLLIVEYGEVDAVIEWRLYALYFPNDEATNQLDIHDAAHTNCNFCTFDPVVNSVIVYLVTPMVSVRCSAQHYFCRERLFTRNQRVSIMIEKRNGYDFCKVIP